MDTVSLRIAAAGFFIAVLLGTRAVAAEYQVQSWTTDNGLPHNIVASLQQTRDGYIWMATFNGLVRFDGVRFTVFDRSNSPGIRNNRFISLYEAADGAIWAGTEGGGVTRYERGSFVTFTTQDGLTSNHVLGVTGDAAGKVWVLSDRQLMAWDGSRFRPVALPQPGLPFYRSSWNPRVFWASGRKRLYRFADGRLDERPIPGYLHGLSNNRFEEDSAQFGGQPRKRHRTMPALVPQRRAV